jgi:hypothetical protein
MTQLQVSVGGDGLQIRRLAGSVPNEQSRTADKRWQSSFEFGGELATPLRKISPRYGILQKTTMLEVLNVVMDL